MSYLYLNFTSNLDVGLGTRKWGRDDFYTASLIEQYEVTLIPWFMNKNRVVEINAGNIILMNGDNF